MQNESFLRHVQSSPSRTHPEHIPKENDFLPREKMFPPERKNIPTRENKKTLVLYLIIYERVKNVAHLKKDA